MRLSNSLTIDVCSRNISFRNSKMIAEGLANEIMDPLKEPPNSYDINKEDEIERIARAIR